MGPSLLTTKQLIKCSKILRNTTQVIVRNRIFLQTEGQTEGQTDGRRDGRTWWNQYTPDNFVAGGIIMITRTKRTFINNYKFNQVLENWRKVYTKRYMKRACTTHNHFPHLRVVCFFFALFFIFVNCNTFTNLCISS